MKLYYLTGACSLAAHIALHESGLKFETAKVDRKNRVASDGSPLDELNTKGYVPVLLLDSGERLTENVAVLQYIADRVPAAKLAPAAGTMERYRLIEWLAFINSELHKSFSPLFSSIATEETKTYARANLTKRTDWLEKEFGARQFLLGDQFTVADAYLFTILNWFGMRSIDLAHWPNLKKFHERVGSRPSTQAAMKTEGLLK